MTTMNLGFSRDALFLDIDGTLLDIAPTPDSVVVPPPLIASLMRLRVRLGGALAFVSGRTIDSIDALFAPMRASCSGVHGAEMRFSANGEVIRHKPLPEALRQKIAETFAGMAGILIEDKIYSIAVHYRLVPEKGPQAETMLTSLIRDWGDELVLTNSRKTLELLQSHFDKGRAVERLLTVPPFRGRRPVYLGDDVADLLAIDVCMKNGGAGIRVGCDDNLPHAFSSPAKVRAWINRLAESP